MNSINFSSLYLLNALIFLALSLIANPVFALIAIIFGLLTMKSAGKSI